MGGVPFVIPPEEKRMPLIKYVGPHDAVDIPSLGVTAVRGEPVDVPADAAKSLLAQSVFEPVSKSTKEK